MTGDRPVVGLLSSSLAHNAENLKIILCRAPVNLYIGHTGAVRPLLTPGDEFLEFFTRAFGYGFDRAVRTISYPTGEAEILRLVNGRSAEVDALNPTLNHHMRAHMVLILCHRAIFLARPLQSCNTPVFAKSSLLTVI